MQDVLITDLKSQIEHGNVVIIAGTGVYVVACSDQKIDGYPVARWDGILLRGVDYCLNVEHVLDSKSPGTYGRWLQDTVGKLEPIRPELLCLLASFPGVLATLNY